MKCVEYDYQLRAVHGDCEGEVIRIWNDDWPFIQELLRAQLEHQIACVDFGDRARLAAVERLNDIGNRLIDRAIFGHKWHKRCVWVLEEVPAEEEIDGPVELHLIRNKEEA